MLFCHVSRRVFSAIKLMDVMSVAVQVGENFKKDFEREFKNCEIQVRRDGRKELVRQGPNAYFH